MIDHISLGVSDIAKARVFYDPILAALGVHCLEADQDLAAYGISRPEFLLLKPFDGKQCSGGNGSHVAFAAGSEAAVDECHRIALKNGGLDEGAPGPREFYPMPDVYTGYVRDPFGNKLEIIHNGFSRI